MWQYTPNCFTQAAVTAGVEPALGSGPADAVVLPADGFGLKTNV